MHYDILYKNDSHHLKVNRHCRSITWGALVILGSYASTNQMRLYGVADEEGQDEASKLRTRLEVGNHFFGGGLLQTIPNIFNIHAYSNTWSRNMLLDHQRDCDPPNFVPTPEDRWTQEQASWHVFFSWPLWLTRFGWIIRKLGQTTCWSL